MTTSATAKPTSYIGSKISLISNSKIRYEGVLYTVDQAEATLALAKVKTFGTEDRPTDHPMPPRDDVFEYIIFKATDIHELLVYDTQQPAPQLYGGLPYDPAIVSMSKLQGPQKQNDLSTNVHNAAAKLINSSRLSSRSISPTNQKLPSGFEKAPPQNRAPGAGRREPQSYSASVIGGAKSNLAQSQQQQQQQQIHHQQQQQQQSHHHQQHRKSAADEDDESVDESRSRGSFQSREAQVGFYRSRGMYRRGNTTRGGAFIHRGGDDSKASDAIYRDGFGGGGGNSRGSRGTYDYDRSASSSRGRGAGQSRGLSAGGNAAYDHRARRASGGGYIARGFLSRGGGGSRGGGANDATLQHRKFDSDYDFESANEKFQETLNHMKEEFVSKAKLDESKENCSESSLANVSQVLSSGGEKDDLKGAYNKEKSFFDSISCEASENLDAHNKPNNWRRERELNQETFGQSGVRNFQFRRGMGRAGGGPRGGFRRGAGHFGGESRNFTRYR